MLAAQDGHLDCVGRLMDANAALDIQDKVRCWLHRITGHHYYNGPSTGPVLLARWGCIPPEPCSNPPHSHRTDTQLSLSLPTTGAAQLHSG